jgi:hypothetical protein
VSLQAQAITGAAFGGVFLIALHLVVRRRKPLWWLNPISAGLAQFAFTMIVLLGPRLLMALLGMGKARPHRFDWCGQLFSALPYAAGAGIGLALCLWLVRPIADHIRRDADVVRSGHPESRSSGSVEPRADTEVRHDGRDIP